MAEGLLTTLDRLYKRIEETTELNHSLLERCKMLEERNADLEREAREMESERDKALLDVEYLCVSHKLADDPDRLVDARRRIAGLIRNIDRCLEMLKE